jgi:2-polyprenyl-6-methoxyphenol hydroxylase-like FAD-dependent oxidoreductase
MDLARAVEQDVAMAATDDILIFGAGIAGLTLAAGLDQRGMTAEVVERNCDSPTRC